MTTSDSIQLQARGLGELPHPPLGLFAVHIELDGSGLVLDGGPAPVQDLAEHVAGTPDWARRPVVLVAHGRPLNAGLAPQLATTLVAYLGVPVYASSGAVRAAHGLLLASEPFWCWWPFASGGVPAVSLQVRGRVVGRRLPELAPRRPGSGGSVPLDMTAFVARSPVPAAVRPAGMSGPQPPGGRAPDSVVAVAAAEAVTAPAAVTAATDATTSRTLSAPPAAASAADVEQLAQTAQAAEPAQPATAGGSLPWTRVQPGAQVEDRQTLQELLGWRYETHSRAVTGVLALQPGLRSALAGIDPLASLVSVRAYLLDRAAEVDAALRAAQPSAGQDDTARRDAAAWQVLASCAMAGTQVLPALRGPVFIPADVTRASVNGLQPGQVIVEPSFVGAARRPGAEATCPVQYAVWSTSGRRTERLLTAADPPCPTVLLQPGTRFGVLNVDAGAGGGPLTVFLKDLTAPIRQLPDEEVLDRLRVALQHDPQDDLVLAGRGLPLGAGHDGQPFATAPADDADPTPRSVQ
ncbi:hypothetical protein ACPPVT_03380 [Angustibacter sp. McL0619]|uniref:hypothetical protein n=1 Tax=Angustibacter sp. McL0619 TaxID=3415676 RepID=UPI003CF13533